MTRHTHVHHPPPAPPQAALQPHVNGWALLFVFAMLATTIILVMKKVIEPWIYKALNVVK